MTGYNHTNTAGTANTLLGYSHTNVAGSYNFIAGGNTSINRTGSYNIILAHSSDVSGTGNAVLGYNPTTNANYSVSIGRNLVNNTTDGVMIANNFQRLGFYGNTPIARQTLANNAPNAQIVLALKNLGLVA